MVLRDFAVDINGNGQLSLTNCSQFGLQDLDTFPQGISLSGSTVVIRDCNFSGNLSVSAASAVEMINSHCQNLTVNGSAFHAENSTFSAFTSTGDSNVTLVDSNLPPGTLQEARHFYEIPRPPLQSFSPNAIGRLTGPPFRPT